MMYPRYETPLPASPELLGVNQCPRLGSLIDYAVGKASGPERQRIETHLKDDDCSHCRRWVEQAGRFRNDGAIDPRKVSALSSLSANSPPPSPDQTPVPENSRWQRQAFGELEKRLQLLEES